MDDLDKRTPTPWTFDEHGGTFYIFGPDAAMVADGETEEGYLARIRGVGRGATVEEQRANAAFIVRACNAHDSLLACLDALAPLVESVDAMLAGAGFGAAKKEPLGPMVREAVALARGGR